MTLNRILIHIGFYADERLLQCSFNVVSEAFVSEPLKADLNVAGVDKEEQRAERERTQDHSLLVGVSATQISSVPIVRV